MTILNHAALNAAIAAGRKALQNYSSFDSSMVPDDALATFSADVITAYLNAIPHPQPTKGPST
jgi:hypothetical protein